MRVNFFFQRPVGKGVDPDFIVAVAHGKVTEFFVDGKGSGACVGSLEGATGAQGDAHGLEVAGGRGLDMSHRHLLLRFGERASFDGLLGHLWTGQ